MFEDFSLFAVVAKSGPSSLANVALLLFMSVGVWAVVAIKWLGNRRKRGEVTKWESALSNRASFQELRLMARQNPDSALARITYSALKEIEGLSAYVSFDSLQSRGELVQEAIERAVDSEKDINERHLTYLAICAAVGPLLGLLGTVWGIMNAFMRIGQLGSANITVVAPGIAEALVTTIAGLLVAIPAAVAYNYFASFNRKVEALMLNYGSHLVSMFKRGDLTALERSAVAE